MPKATKIVLKPFVNDVTRLYSRPGLRRALWECRRSVSDINAQSRKSPPSGALPGPVALAAPSPPPPYVQLHQIRRDVELARLTHPGVDVQVLAPSAPLRARPLEFDPDGLARIVDLGRADAADCLRAWGD